MGCRKVKVVYIPKNKGNRIIQRVNLPKTAIKLGEGKSYTSYQCGTLAYLVAKPGIKLVRR